MYSQEVLYKKSRKVGIKQKVDVMIKPEVEVIYFEDGERGHKPRNIGTSRRWKRQEKTFSLKASRRNAALPTP